MPMRRQVRQADGIVHAAGDLTIREELSESVPVGAARDIEVKDVAATLSNQRCGDGLADTAGVV